MLVLLYFYLACLNKNIGFKIYYKILHQIKNKTKYLQSTMF